MSAHPTSAGGTTGEDAGGAIDRTEFLARLARLGLEPSTYVVHGSGPLLLHGIVDAVGDIDLVVDADTWRRLADLPEARVRRADVDRVVVLPAAIEAYDGWFGAPAERVLERAERCAPNLLCASLADVLAFKRRLGRAKDEAHVRAIERHLARLDRPSAPC